MTRNLGKKTMPFLLDWSDFGSPSVSTTLTDGANSTDFTANPGTGGSGTPPSTTYSDSFGGSLRASGVDPGELTGAILNFADPVRNVSFEIFDLDANPGGWDDRIIIIARDADGNNVPIQFSDLEAYHQQIGSNSVEANGNSSTGVEGPGAADSITVTIPGPVTDIQVIFTAGTSGDSSGVIGLGNITGTIVCFARGMLIETPHGKVRVEDLQAGDEVITLDHGPQPIRWIGSRTVPALGRFAPVVIERDTLGKHDTLVVSPQHRILITGWQAELMFGEAEVLVAAKHLQSLDQVYTREGGDIEYFHILFDRHEIIFAQDLPSESYHPGVLGLNGMEDAQREEIFALFPELAENPNSFGPSARASLAGYEGRALAQTVLG